MPEHAHRSEPETKADPETGIETKGNIGEQLRKQRKAKGISLVEVSEHTKIGKKYLEALENGEYDVLPGETYIRGFLKAYAKYLDLDDDEIIRHYKVQRRMADHEDAGADGEGGQRAESNQSLWGPLLAVLVLAGLGAGVFLFWSSLTGKKPEPRADGSDAASSEFAAGLPAPAANAGDLVLKIRAKEKTWITIMADGRQEPDVTLNPNEERTWTAKERFVLWTGNAGGVEVWFNNELQPPLGAANEVRKEVVFERKAASNPPGGTLP